MGVEQLSSNQQFIEASTQMSEAWKKMVQTGQVKTYQRLGEERIEQLINGKKPKPGEEYITQYLEALRRFLSSTKTVSA